MKYFLIIIGVLIALLLIGYQYLDFRLIKAQEDSFKELASLNFKESPRYFSDSLKMNDTQFWALIEGSKKNSPNNFDAQMNFLTHHLSSLSNEEIIGFEATLKEKVIELWDYKVKSLYQILFDNYLSTDGFIYFRLWIISNGKSFYTMALTNPDHLAEDIEATYEGEGLMIVADNAFELKNGSNPSLELPRDLTSAVSYDFGSYRMTGEYIAPSEFKNKFPKLTEKF